MEASLEALYDAVENSEDFDKRHLATRMILRLFHHHEGLCNGISNVLK